MRKLLHYILIVCCVLFASSSVFADHEQGHAPEHVEGEHIDGDDPYAGEEFDDMDYDPSLEGAGEGGDVEDDDYVDFPEESFNNWYSGTATAVGQESAAKTIVRYKLDEAEWMMEDTRMILEMALELVNEAGFDLLPGMTFDATEKMQVKMDTMIEEDTLELEGHRPELNVRSFVVTRLPDSRSSGELMNAEVFQIDLIMVNSMDDEEHTDVIRIKTAIAEQNNGTTVVHTDFAGSFGGFSHEVNSRTLMDTETQETKQRNIKVSMQDSQYMLECSDPDDPSTCEENEDVAFEFSNQMTLEQRWDDEGIETGKIAFRTSHGGGTDEMIEKNNGGWGPDGGCLEMAQEWNIQVDVNNDVCSYHGDEGTAEYDKCNLGRDFARNFKIEDLRADGVGDAIRECNDEGVCIDSFRVVDNVVENVDGFSCHDPEMTFECNGFCEEGEENSDDAIAWIDGCIAGLHEDVDDLLSDAESYVDRQTMTTSECWDPNGLVSVSKAESSFGHNDHVDPEFVIMEDVTEEIVYDEPVQHCEISFDETIKVELLSDGTELCVPDHHAEDTLAAAGTPLCSELTPEDNPCG